jgi:hypothetical protein
MLDDKRRAELDQGMAEMGESMPKIWKSLYSGLKEEFTEAQAWELLKVAVFANMGGKGVT